MINPILGTQLNLFYTKLGFLCKNFKLEKESAEYDAATFDLNQHKILFRAAKITPTKTGQFVTLWKRINNAPIQPFDLSDPIDFVIIRVQTGQFVFPKKVLGDRKIFSINQKGGKRAVRVYAPRDIVNSKQAISTQKWQSEFFISFEENDHLSSSIDKFLKILKMSK